MGWTWHLDADTADHADALQLTDAEKIVLASFNWLQSKHGPRTMYEVCEHGVDNTSHWALDQRQAEAYLSLCRMAYIVESKPRTVRKATVADVLAPAGEKRLSGMRAQRYKCCGYAIVLPCVCSERTYCPDHGGGCHGTHD
jgi:hypothetical protein